MKSTKKTWIHFRRIILILFIIYLVNYFQVESGNYINEYQQKTIITQEKIEEFEKDIQKGNSVDVKNYIESNYIDTSTPVTDLGYDLGVLVDTVLNEKVSKIFGFIGNLFK